MATVGFTKWSDIWHLGCAKESPMPIEGVDLKSNLVVIGLNHRSAPVEVRERFWIGESRRYEALHQLAAHPIEEVVGLATCNRTEFIAVPRDIDPTVREVPGVFLYDIDDLDRVVSHNLSERQAAAAEAERIVVGEAQTFRRKLSAERVVPVIVAVRERL